MATPAAVTLAADVTQKSAKPTVSHGDVNRRWLTELTLAEDVMEAAQEADYAAILNEEWVVGETVARLTAALQSARELIPKIISAHKPLSVCEGEWADG